MTGGCWQTEQTWAMCTPGPVLHAVSAHEPRLSEASALVGSAVGRAAHLLAAYGVLHDPVGF